MTTRKHGRTAGSEEALYAALIALVQEQGFERTTVQHILDRAHVGRATFYAHFRSKEDLLMYGLDRFRSELRALGDHAGLPALQRVLAFSAHVFRHASGHTALYAAMAGRRSGETVARQMHMLLAGVIREDLRSHVEPQTLEPIVQWVTGGMVGLLRWWIEAPRRMSADELDELFRALTVPALEQLVARAQPVPTATKATPKRARADRT